MVSERWVVLEAQTASDNSVATIVTAYETIEQAQSAFYGILASAAVSQVPVHAASLLSNEGFLLESKCFSHQAEQ